MSDRASVGVHDDLATLNDAIETYVADVCPDEKQIAAYVNGWRSAHKRVEAEIARLQGGLRLLAERPFTAALDAREMRDQARALLAEQPTCKCPSGSYNPGAVHDPYCPLAEDGA